MTSCCSPSACYWVCNPFMGTAWFCCALVSKILDILHTPVQTDSDSFRSLTGQPSFYSLSQWLFLPEIHKYRNNVHNNILLHIFSKERKNGFKLDGHLGAFELFVFVGTLRCFGGRAQFSSLLLFTFSLSSSPLPPPPSSRHSFVPNTHNAFDNSLHFPTE